MLGLLTPALIAGLLFAFSSFAGDFGRKKYTVPVTVVSPPEMPLPGRTFAIKQAAGATFRDWAVLKLAVDQALSSEFTPAASGADLTLTVAVSNYVPVVAKQAAVTENRNVVVGKKPLTNPFTGKPVLRNGKPVLVDDSQPRPVAVQYWEARGEIALQISVEDSSGARLDSSFSPRSEYSNRVETAVNRVASKHETLPTAEELQALLIRQISAGVQKRYTKSRKSIEVRLAIDDPLRAGNALAASGQWNEALAAWSSAQMKKNPADRIYNMAVAHEAIAYKSFDAGGDPAAGEESAQLAVKLYREALGLDPREKVIRDAMERSAAIQANFGRAKEQYAAEQRRLEIEAANAGVRRKEEEVVQAGAGAGGSKSIDANRPDTAEEAKFRAHVRGRWRSLSEAPPEDRQNELIRLGQNGYKLGGDSAQRVVAQEAARLHQVKANRESYRQAVADYLRAGTTLDASKRAQLNELASLLELAPEDVKAIEAQFKFTDLTAQSAAPAVAKPAKPRAAPATQGVKP
ncbi:MAG: hypothetical protein WD696_19960 [Bryobacteraceae bacterium]